MPPQPLQSETDLSLLLSPARDQGPRGTCASFAITALHEAGAAPHSSATASQMIADFSEEVLYWGAKQVDKNYIPGTSFRSIHVALRTWGQPEEIYWPYDPLRNDRDANYKPPPDAIMPENCSLRQLMATAIKVEPIKTHIATGQAVAAVLVMSLGFFTAPNGIVPIPNKNEMIMENHAVLLTGYSDTNSTFLFRNSWGQSWGKDGYGMLPYEYLIRHGKSACILLPTEEL